MTRPDPTRPRQTVRRWTAGLRFKFLFWVTLVLVVTLAGTATHVAGTQRGILEDSLDRKARALGQFTALISPAAIHAFDITTLDRYAAQVSADPDIRFALVVDARSNPLTTALPPGVPRGAVRAWASGNTPETRPDLRVLRFPVRDTDANPLGEVILGVDLSALQGLTRRVLLLQGLIYGAIILFLGLVVVSLFRRNVLRPVESLMAGAARIGRGDLSQPLAVSSDDELGRLATCFNEMMGELAHDRAEILAANERLSAEIALRQQTSRELIKLSRAVEQSPASVVITDLNGRIEYVNPKFSELTGYQPEEVIGQNPRILNSGYAPAKFFTEMWRTISAGQVWEGEFRNKRKNGEYYWESGTITPIRQDDGRITHYLAVKEDVTERKAFEARLYQQATHDSLTQLPNRAMASDRLQQLVEHAKRYGERVGVAFIDLDNFKTVNDTMGHACGDRLLVEAAGRLRRRLRAEDTLARLGGDEFLALLPGLGPDPVHLGDVIDKLVRALEAPFRLDGREFVVTASVGYAVYPDDGEVPDLLLRHADAAMYQAKRNGRNGYCAYTPAIDRSTLDRAHLETGLRLALDRNELYPVYQPIVRLGDGAVVGAEVLLRWRSPQLGAVSPARFIPLAEELGQIGPISRWTLGAVMGAAAAWPLPPGEAFSLSFNVSPLFFTDPSFPAAVAAALEAARPLGIGITLEITEGLLLRDVDENLERFRDLKEMGVRFAMDDFGTGYSSLVYIKRFPLDYLKIDRAFISGLPEDAEDRALVDAVVLMGHRLGHRLVAEGVETADQAAYLDRLGVEYAQGFYYARPLPEAEFRQRLLAPCRAAVAATGAHAV